MKLKFKVRFFKVEIQGKESFPVISLTSAFAAEAEQPTEFRGLCLCLERSGVVENLT